MKLSTKSRYGLRAMISISEQRNKSPVNVKTIAEEQDISCKYLHNILSIFSNHGLIRIKRGIHGGYILAKPPSKISLLEIIKAMEGDLFLVDCVRSKGYCNRSRTCKTRPVWKGLGHSMSNFLSNMTLKDIIDYS